MKALHVPPQCISASAHKEEAYKYRIRRHGFKNAEKSFIRSDSEISLVSLTADVITFP